MSGSQSLFVASVFCMTFASAQVHCRTAWDAARAILTPKFSIVIIVISALIAAWTTLQMRRLPVIIGMDLASEPTEVPVLYYVDKNDEKKRLAEMSRIADKFANGSVSFKVSAIGEKNPLSEDFVILLETYPSNDAAMTSAEIQPEGAWNTRDSVAMIAGDVPATLSYSTIGNDMMLRFQKGNRFGHVSVETSEGSQIIDLYAPKSELLEVPIPTTKRWSRFYAEVPRWALPTLRIETGSNRSPEVKRLFVGTLIPTVFYGDKSYPPDARGRLHPHWEFDVKSGSLRVGAVPRWEQAGAYMFSMFWLVLYATGSLGAIFLVKAYQLLRVHFRRPPLIAPTLQPLKFGMVALFFAPLFGMSLLYFASFYPACMSVEGLTMWDEAHTLKLDDTNPVGYTLAMRMLSFIWDSPAIVVLCQMLALDTMFAYGLVLLLRAGVPFPVVLAAFAVALVSPRNNSMPLWLYRDVPYTALMFAYTLFLARYSLMEPIRKRWTFWLVLGGLVALLPFFRHEGKAHLFLFAFVALFFCWPQRKQVLVSALVALALFFGIKQGLYPTLAVKNATTLANPSFWSEIESTRNITLAHAQDLPIPIEMYEFAADMGFPRTTYAAPYPYGTLESQKVRAAIRETDRLDEAIVHARWVKKRYAPMHYYGQLSTRLLKVPYLFGIASNIRQGLIPPLINFYHPAVIDENFGGKYGLLKRPLLPIGRALLEPLIVYFSEHFRWLYSQPVINMYAVLIAAIILLARGLDYRYLLIFVPVVSNALIILAANASTSGRYYFSLTFASGFLVCLAFLPKPQESKNTAS